MTTRNTDSSQGGGSIPPPPPGPPDQLRSRVGNTVFKSGPLCISSKGIGWTSWKKRWFILTRTSLVFFRSDPSAIPQKGSEVNLTLGGIDLNNSGSVVVKADKKLLTVLFPDGRDGRTFTLKADTLEDLYEWKDALENALAQAPSAALVMGQTGIFRNDQADAADGSWEQLKDRPPVKSLVIGRPILLALEDIDGTPSFLEKALRFIEEYGIKVEGILRQAADVDDVERRVREYEQGKDEFSPEEDPHVVADCVKHVVRELPSSPVPASCCNALLEACRTDRGVRVNAMRAAICETFPEPNRRLLQRILMMMQTVASHKAVNRMSSSAVAACMAPLLLRPLLAGDCELENDFDVGGDGSVQLLQAAAAANHAQAIVITLMEDYDNIFGEGSMSPELYSDSEESGSESEGPTDDDESFEDDDGDDAIHDLDAVTDDDLEHASSGTCSESSDTGGNDLSDDKGVERSSSGSKSPEVDDDFEANQKSSSSPQILLPQIDNEQRIENFPHQSNNTSAVQASESGELLGDVPAEISSVESTAHNPSSCIQKSTTISNGPVQTVRRPTVWGRTAAKKNLSMESIDYAIEDDASDSYRVETQRLEVTKTELQNRIAEEAEGNAILQASLERRKKALHERRLALQQDVARLQEQLQKERDLRATLEAGLKMSRGALPLLATIDEKTKAELEEIALAETDIINLKHKVDDLGVQLNQQRERNYGYVRDSKNQPEQTLNHQSKLKDKQKDIETKAASQLLERSTRSKVQQDVYLDKVDSESERKQEATSLPNKYPSQNQQLDPVRRSNTNSVGVLAISSAVEPVVVRPTAPTNFKKSGTRGEGASSTSSALTKLTTRLTFLKERRTQIANELQNLDRDRGSGQPVQNPEKGRGSESHQSLQKLGECQGSEGLSVQNPEKGRGLDSCQSLQNPDKWVGTEGQSVQNRRSEGQPFQDVGKGRGSEGQSFIPPRTNSR